MRAGTCAVIGRANAGKSTLINVLVGEKISIVSPKPQTTRDRILGILTTDEMQIVFADTPGIYRADGALNEYMQRQTDGTAKDVDLILFAIDGHEGVKAADLALLKKYVAGSVKTVAVMTKIDIMPEAEIPAELLKIAETGVEVVPVSARKGKNLKELLRVIKSNLPEGDRLYGDDVISDKSVRFMIGEIMREKILLGFDREIPHGVAVVVNRFEKRETGNLYDVNLDIICEKPSHKAIIIGKGGEAIKKTSAAARAEMERFLDAKVFLETYVKVKENWRDTRSLLKEYGYYEMEV